MTGTRIRRTLQERIANKKQEVEELENKLKLQEVEKAFEEGRISDENEPEFKALKRELASLKKAFKAANRHGRTELAEQLEAFQGELTDEMGSLLTAEG
jgi:phage host-nuclease inhibitor protein Gam